MSGFQQIMESIPINTKSEDTEQVIETGMDMKHMLELSDWKFEVIVINMLRTLMDIVKNVQLMDERSRQMETKKALKGHSRNYKHYNRLKNALDGPISRPNITKKESVSLKIEQ